MTATDQLLMTMTRMCGGYGCEASLPESDLIVQAWRDWPERFGLRGFADAYPDSKRVTCELCSGKRNGAKCKGLVRRIGPRMYRLTAAGLALGEKLLRQRQQGAAA